jgi:hypothetical protein
LDPFAGRGTAIYSAAIQGRRGTGIEINPVGWVYAKTKLGPASKATVEARLEALASRADEYDEEARRLPEFFRRCFSRTVRRFLLAARDKLEWKTNRIDRTAAALILVYLHGKKEGSLSNQLRQAKSMAPAYAVRWWRENESSPPRVDPLAFLKKRLEWRYARGLPIVAKSNVYLADSAVVLPRLKDEVRGRRGAKAKLLFTSPPYFGRTNYHYDQWLRLWFLGGPPNAALVPGSSRLRGKFAHEAGYREMLRRVFESAAELMSRSGIVYVRTGADDVTRDATRNALRGAFPRKRIRQIPRPFLGPTQTMLFGDSEPKHGEVDLIISLS